MSESNTMIPTTRDAETQGAAPNPASGQAANEGQRPVLERARKAC